MAHYPIFNLQLVQQREYIRKPQAADFKIKFVTTNQSTFKQIVNSNSVIDTDELRQRVRMILRTEYGELAEKLDFGSEVYKYKHLDLFAEETLEGVKQAVVDAITPIIDEDDNLEVDVIPKKGGGPFYCQNVNIYIYINEQMLYYFSL